MQRNLDIQYMCVQVEFISGLAYKLLKYNKQQTHVWMKT